VFDGFTILYAAFSVIMLRTTSAAARFGPKCISRKSRFVFGFACSERDLVQYGDSKCSMKTEKQEYIEPYLTQRSSPESALPKGETRDASPRG
jgi:hypothetical protein